MFDTHPTRTMPHHSANALASADFAKTQTHSAKTALFHRFSPNWSALWQPNSVKSRLCRHQSGGIALHEGATRRRHAARGLRVVQNPHRHRRGERRGHGEPGRSAHEQRQGAAIARLLARGLRQSTALFAQQQPHLAASVQNSPCTPALAACPVQNSPCSPEMAQFGAFSACRESFIPLSPPRSRAGRILYRTRGRDRASQHNTPGTTGLENAGGAGGPGRDAGTRLAGPTRVRRASAKQISHAIRLNQISTNPENVAIPTMQIQCLNKLRGKCMRN